MKLAWISLVIGAVVVFGARLDAEEAGNPTDDLNLLQNGDFAQWDGNNPVHWNVIAGSPVRVEGSNGLSETPQFIHVEADAPVRGSYG